MDVIEDYLTSNGTAFRPNEMEKFFEKANDQETGRIYYEDYVVALSKTLDFTSNYSNQEESK